MDTFSIVLIVLVFASAFGMPVLCLFPYLAQNVLHPRQSNQGDFVAEVWLEWDICRGSTMYRQRFATEKSAARFVKLYAWVLDFMLPKGYMSTDYVGRPKVYAHEFDIRFGVRKLVDGEGINFHPIWTTTMPGYSGHRGEPAQAHPFDRDYSDVLNGSTAGFTV